mgnify:CR=1 FL=1
MLARNCDRSKHDRRIHTFRYKSRSRHAPKKWRNSKKKLPRRESNPGLGRNPSDKAPSWPLNYAEPLTVSKLWGAQFKWFWIYHFDQSFLQPPLCFMEGSRCNSSHFKFLLPGLNFGRSFDHISWSSRRIIYFVVPHFVYFNMAIHIRSY